MGTLRDFQAVQKALRDTAARAGGERETTEQQKLRGAEY